VPAPARGSGTGAPGRAAFLQQCNPTIYTTYRQFSEEELNILYAKSAWCAVPHALKTCFYLWKTDELM
jgi:hypothetical protein